MFRFFSQVLLALSGVTIAIAIPNTIIGGLAQVDSPLNGQDVTERILSADVWSGARELPGKWRLESTVAGAKTSHLLALPKVLGEDVVLLRAVRREGRLDSLVVTFADAGSYFQYQPNVAKDQLAARRKALVERQRQFAELYQARHERITERLEAMSKARVKRAKQGASRALRAELKVYQVGGLKLGLLADGNRIIRLTISREIAHEKSWLDESIQKMNANSRGAYFRSQVKEDANGDSIIASVPVVPQGYKPYCGINTLVMTAHYFGLHLDEDWLAVAGKFQNTGSAGNSNMFGLYNAVAKEARLKISRETEFDFRKARALMRDGMPVIVWRKFDYRRNQLHNKISRRMIKDPHAKLPEPNADDRAKWPGKDHPVHASVIVGFNDERKEVLFLESWAGVTSPRRMRYEEMEATATWAFYFRNR